MLALTASPFRGVDVELPALECVPLTTIVDLGEDMSLSISPGTANRPFVALEGVTAFGSLASFGSFSVDLSLGASWLRGALDLGLRASSGLCMLPSAVLAFFCGWIFSSGSGGRFRLSCVCEFLALSLDCDSALRGRQR